MPFARARHAERDLLFKAEKEAKTPRLSWRAVPGETSTGQKDSSTETAWRTGFRISLLPRCPTPHLTKSRRHRRAGLCPDITRRLDPSDQVLRITVVAAVMGPRTGAALEDAADPAVEAMTVVDMDTRCIWGTRTRWTPKMQLIRRRWAQGVVGATSLRRDFLLRCRRLPSTPRTEGSPAADGTAGIFPMAEPRTGRVAPARCLMVTGGTLQD